MPSISSHPVISSRLIMIRDQATILLINRCPIQLRPLVQTCDKNYYGVGSQKFVDAPILAAGTKPFSLI